MSQENQYHNLPRPWNSEHVSDKINGYDPMPCFVSDGHGNRYPVLGVWCTDNSVIIDIDVDDKYPKCPNCQSNNITHVYETVEEYISNYIVYKGLKCNSCGCIIDGRILSDDDIEKLNNNSENGD